MLDCSYYRMVTVAILFLLPMLTPAQSDAPTPPWARGCRGYIPPPAGFWEPGMARGEPGRPMAYKDATPGELFYAESDRRHIAAMSAAGKILWVRDQLADLKLCPYRTLRPVIAEIRAPIIGDHAVVKIDARLGQFWKRRPHLIIVQYDSSQWVYVDVGTGDACPGGNN
jgi:hypothetical protein